MGLFTSIASLGTGIVSLFSGGKSQAEKDFYLMQTKILGMQYSHFKGLVEKKNIYALTNTFLVPLTAFLFVCYLFYKKLI